MHKLCIISTNLLEGVSQKVLIICIVPEIMMIFVDHYYWLAMKTSQVYIMMWLQFF